MGDSYDRAKGVAAQLLGERSLFRFADLEAGGASHVWLDMLCFTGGLKRRPPGVYGDLDTIFPRAVCAAVKWPRSVVFGLSALALHELCPEPHDVWLAIDAKALPPICDELPLKFVHSRGLRTDTDIVTLWFDACAVRVFSPARAIVDCLRCPERQPPALVEIAIANAIARGLVDIARIAEVASRRRCLRDVTAMFSCIAANPPRDPSTIPPGAAYVEPPPELPYAFLKSIRRPERSCVDPQLRPRQRCPPQPGSARP